MLYLQLLILLTMILSVKSDICCIKFKEIFKQKICETLVTCPTQSSPNMIHGFLDPGFFNIEAPKITVTKVEYQNIDKPKLDFAQTGTTGVVNPIPGTNPPGFRSKPVEGYPKISMGLKKLLDQMQILYYDTLPIMEEDTWNSHSGVIPGDKFGPGSGPEVHKGFQLPNVENNDVNVENSFNEPDSLFTASFNCFNANTLVSDTEDCVQSFDFK